MCGKRNRCVVTNLTGRSAGPPAKRLPDGRCPLRTDLLEGADRLLMAHCQADVVEPFEQPPAAEVVQRERPRVTAGAYLTGLQVNGNRCGRVGFHRIPQGFDCGEV